jgi:hypothetical protein
MMHNNGRSILGLGVLAFVCMFISLVNPSNAYSSELKAGAPDAEICVPAELPHTHILAFNRQMNNTSVSKETECAMTENERDLLRIATTPPTSNKEKYVIRLHFCCYIIQDIIIFFISLNRHCCT